MKKNNSTVISSQQNPEIEKLILQSDKRLKELAQKNAKHFASKNLPSADEDSISPYTSDIRAGYDAIKAEVLHKLQPATHFPEASVDAEHLKEKDKILDQEIKKREDLNKNDQYQIGDGIHSSVKGRLNLAIVITLILTIGETIFNAVSFSVFGENLLFALLLSLAVTLGAILLAHFAAFLFKSSKSNMHRWLIAFVTLIIASSLFSSLAIFRSRYLEYHEVHISPFYFFVFNLFFFVVAALLSLFLLPTWQEIKANLHRNSVQKIIRKRKSEIESMKGQKADIKKSVVENTKFRIRDSNYTSYLVGYIDRLFIETIGQFKTCNLTYRTDGLVPKCFIEEVNDLKKMEYDFLLESKNS